MPIDGPGIQARVDRGLGIAARKAGFPYGQYRPSGPTDPLRLLNRIGTIQAVFDARPALSFLVPALHQDAVRYAIVNGSLVEPGDYLVGGQVGAGETLFVAYKPDFYTPVCVRCNAVISLLRLGAATDFGAIPDRSDAGSEVPIIQNWPASLLFTGRGGGDAVTTPGDLPSPEYMLLLPAIPDVEAPRPGDTIVDDQGRRFAVAWHEASVAGWRIAVKLLTIG